MKTIALLGAGAARYADWLAAYVSDVRLLPPCPQLDPRVASHPDMLVMTIGTTLVTAAQYAAQPDTAAVIGFLAAHGCSVIRSVRSLTAVYPHDIAYNALSAGRFLLGRIDCLAPEVLDAARAAGMIPVPVRQGYAGCAALAWENGVITADPSVARAARECGLAVTQIVPGGIALPGYDTGFIGGAGGICPADRRAFFFGDPASHPDGGRIREALDAAGIESVPLGGGALADFGGIKFVNVLQSDETCDTIIGRKTDISGRNV